MYAWMVAAGQAWLGLVACCPEAGAAMLGATALLLLGPVLERRALPLEVSLGCFLAVLRVALERLLPA